MIFSSFTTNGAPSLPQFGVKSWMNLNFVQLKLNKLPNLHIHRVQLNWIITSMYASGQYHTMHRCCDFHVTTNFVQDRQTLDTIWFFCCCRYFELYFCFCDLHFITIYTHVITIKFSYDLRFVLLSLSRSIFSKTILLGNTTGTVGRYLLLTSLCTHSWKVDGCHFGG